MQRSLSHLAVAAAAIVLAACSSAPTRFYTLAPPASSSHSANSTGGFIDVAPVSVPERLARPQIVVRTDDARVDILEQDRWSSPFNSELHDALASGISSRLGAIDVSQGGAPATAPVFRIQVEVRQFDATRGGKVQAQFGWTISRSDEAGNRAVCRLSVQEPVAGPAVADLVQSMQRTVDNLADAIATDVIDLRDGVLARCSH